MGANTVCGGVVRGSLRRGDGQIPQPGGAAMGDDIGIDRHKTTACVTRMTAQGHRLPTTRSTRQETGGGCRSRSKTASSIWCGPIPEGPGDRPCADQDGEDRCDDVGSPPAHRSALDRLYSASRDPRSAGTAPLPGVVRALAHAGDEHDRRDPHEARVRTPTKTAFGVKSRRMLATGPVRAWYRGALDGDRRQLAPVTTEIRGADQVIGAQVLADTQAQLLCTLPGIEAYSARLIRSESGDMLRFPDHRYLCAYAGVMPSVQASADTTRWGRFTKQGSSGLRWILVDVLVPAIKGAPQVRSLDQRVTKKHGTNVGRVAVARALLKTISEMRTPPHPFRPIRRRGTPVSAERGQARLP